MGHWFVRCSALVAVFFVLVVACGNSDSADGGSGGPRGGAKCSEYVRALCDWQVRCDTTRTITLDTCLAQNAQTCAFFELPGVTVDGADFRACIDRYERNQCSSPTLRCPFPVGTATGNCAFDLQCTTGLCSKVNGACGRCAYVPRNPLGGECREASDCEDAADCVGLVCTARRKVGESCGGEHTCEPFSGDAYVACVGGTCIAGGQPGEPCLEAGSGAWYCGPRLVCSPLKTCVPVRMVEPGEHCGDFTDQSLFCRGGNCNSPGDPEKSQCVSWPGIGESCKKVTEYERCADGMYCDWTVDKCALVPLPTLPDSCEY